LGLGLVRFILREILKVTQANVMLTTQILFCESHICKGVSYTFYLVGIQTTNAYLLNLEYYTIY